MEKNTKLSDADEQVLFLAEKVEGLILEGRFPPASKEAFRAATMLQLYYRVSHDDPQAPEKALPLARGLMKIWMKLPEEARRALCNGWALPNPRRFPNIGQLREYEGRFFDEVDSFLSLERFPDGSIHGAHRFFPLGGTTPVRVSVRSCSTKAEVMAALHDVLRKVDAEWSVLTQLGANDIIDLSWLDDRRISKEPAETAGDERTVSRAALGEMLGRMGKAGEEIAALVMQAVSRAPCELSTWTKGEMSERIDSVDVERPAWEVPGLPLAAKAREETGEFYFPSKYAKRSRVGRRGRPRAAAAKAQKGGKGKAAAKRTA